MRIQWIRMVVIVGFFLQGCGEPEPENSSLSKYSGDWKTECRQKFGADGSRSEDSSLEIEATGNNMAMVFTTYKDTKCASPASQSGFRANLGFEGTSEFVFGADQVRLQIVAVTGFEPSSIRDRNEIFFLRTNSWPHTLTWGDPSSCTKQCFEKGDFPRAIDKMQFVFRKL